MKPLPFGHSTSVPVPQPILPLPYFSESQLAEVQGARVLANPQNCAGGHGA